MNSRVLILMAALMMGLLVLSGCSTDNNEHQRLVTEAALVNNGGPIFVAARNNNGTSDNLLDDYVPIEFMSVVFSARPLNDTMVIPEGGTYSTFNVTHYDLNWVPGMGAPAALTDYNVSRGNITVAVPVNDEAMGAVLIGSLAMKSEAWFPGAPFVADCLVTFYGHESGSEHEVAIHAGTTVQFLFELAE